MECKNPAQSEIQIQIKEELYKSMMKETKSIGHMVLKVVHQIITPMFLLQKTRKKMKGLMAQDYTITIKVQEA